ncbi:MAG: nicotinate (nicotinamide) nucleotide adenylyltransferase [Nitrospinota bacterium]|nr:nicotinate (nicotinamide) nucleotide adenylyltransferase [Nitrospinota bacterium]
MTLTRREKSGILGGTFDPVTLGHLGMALDIEKKLNLDRIWFIPAWRSPHKQEQAPAEAEHRLNMLKAALAPYRELQISEWELDQKGISYTINTLTALQNSHPESELYLILGMDTFQDFASWKNVTEILQTAHLAVATRPGYCDIQKPQTLQTLLDNLPFTYSWGEKRNGVQTCNCPETGKTIVFCDIEPREISSSIIRQRIGDGLSVKKMLPPEVLEYIITHRLYQANPKPQPE